MRTPRGANALLPVILVLLVAGLAVLATLQYRWIDRVSDAERMQMRANTEFAAHRFIDGFNGELEPALEIFGRRGAEPMGQLEEWTRRAAHPSLIEAVYVIDLRDASPSLRRLDPSSGVLIDTPWPPLYTHLQSRIAERAQRRARGPLPGPFIADGPALLVVHPPDDPPPPRSDDPRPTGFPPQDRGPGGPTHFILLQLRGEELTGDILPALALRHFPTAGGGYDVAVTNGRQLLYRSNAAWPDGRTAADVEIPFSPLGLRGGPERRPRMNRFGGPPPADEPPLHLLVRRHNGGLDAVIASARLRNLALGFGILLVLSLTVGVLFALLRRAHRLSAQQTEFVASISHELNTPVAALRSAGENLRDGIVVDPDKVARYGTSIVREASRLGDMLGQVLEYAGMQSGRNQRSRETVSVAAVIDEAVAQCRWLLEGTAIEIATDVDPALPDVLGDAKALTGAVQNLLSNAIRYGGSGRWVGVRAQRNGTGEISITVEDRGPGIDSRDASRLFEPFYRGRNHGVGRGAGLGLSIVRRVVEAHGGRVELAKRSRGEGAAFTIHLPVESHG